MVADEARDRFKKIRVRFAEMPARLALSGAAQVKLNGRDAEILAIGNSERLVAELRSKHRPEELLCESLSLEEIFVASQTMRQSAA